jgi:hypothetical protein
MPATRTGDPGLPSAIQPFALDIALDEVMARELGTWHIERGELGSGVLTLRAEDTARLDLVGLAQELDEDGHAVDIACPSKARLPLTEAGFLQVVLESTVRLRSFVAECKSDDKVDVGGAYMRAGTLGQLPDQVPRG